MFFWWSKDRCVFFSFWGAGKNRLDAFSGMMYNLSTCFFFARRKTDIFDLPTSSDPPKKGAGISRKKCFPTKKGRGTNRGHFFLSGSRFCSDLQNK